MSLTIPHSLTRLLQGCSSALRERIAAHWQANSPRADDLLNAVPDEHLLYQLVNQCGREERWTLFDTGARNTYVVPAVAEGLATAETRRPIRTALGGEVKQAYRTALLHGEVEGRLVSTHALVVDEIGTDEDGRAIEILFGALAMQQWGIRPVPDEERLDLSHYPEEFVEF